MSQSTAFGLRQGGLLFHRVYVFVSLRFCSLYCPTSSSYCYVLVDSFPLSLLLPRRPLSFPDPESSIYVEVSSSFNFICSEDLKEAFGFL